MTSGQRGTEDSTILMSMRENGVEERKDSSQWMSGHDMYFKHATKVSRIQSGREFTFVRRSMYLSDLLIAGVMSVTTDMQWWRAQSS